MISGGNGIYNPASVPTGTLFTGWDGMFTGVGGGGAAVAGFTPMPFAAHPPDMSIFTLSGMQSASQVVPANAAHIFAEPGRIAAAKFPPIDDIEARAGKGVLLTDLLGHLTSGAELPSEDALRNVIQKNSVGLNELIKSSPGNSSYWEDVLEAFYIKSQFSMRSRGVVELVTNGIDATRRVGGSDPVHVALNDDGAAVEDAGSGMTLIDIFSRLLPPSVRDESDTKGIGRFGVGFYSILNYLNETGDRVIVQTSDGSNVYNIIFSRDNDGYRVAMSMDKNLKAETGTRVTVRSASLDRDAVGRMIHDTLEFNDHLPLYLGDGLVNPERDLEVVNGGPCRIEYSKGISGNGRGLGVILVDGVVVQRVPIAGSNVPELVKFVLPSDTPLPISRNAFELPTETVNAIREIFGHLPAEAGTATIANGLWPIVRFLQAKNTSLSTSDDLELAFKRSVQGILSGSGLFFPDEVNDDDIDKIVRPFIVHPELYHENFVTHSGVEVYSDLFVTGARVVMGGVNGENARHKPQAKRFQSVIVVDEKNPPEGLVEKAILASWMETTGAKAQLPRVFESVQDVAEDDVSESGLSEEQIRANVLAFRKSVLEDPLRSHCESVLNHPVLGPLFDEITSTFFRHCKDCETEIWNVLFNLEFLLKGEGFPSDHIDFVMDITRRYARHYPKNPERKQQEDEMMVMAFLIKHLLRDGGEVARYIESHLSPDERRLFRVFAGGNANRTMAERVMEIVMPILAIAEHEGKIDIPSYYPRNKHEFNRMLDDPGMKKFYNRIFPSESSSSLFAYIIYMFALIYPVRFTDEREILTFREIALDAMDRVIESDFDVVREQSRRTMAIYIFLRTKQGREIYYSDEWQKWKYDVFENMPFGDHNEEKTIVNGYLHMDGYLEELYDIARTSGVRAAQDFLYFVGSIGDHYYMGNPPQEVIERCIGIWRNHILKMGRESYERLRTEVYLLFAEGADEVYVSNDIQPYVSLVLGEIDGLSELELHDSWRIGDARVESFNLSEHVRNYLSSEGDARTQSDEATAAATIGDRFARSVVGQAINDQSTDRAIFTRELLQSALNEAAKRDTPADGHTFEILAREDRDGNFVSIFSDPFGISPEDVDEYLLIPGKSSKNFGQGFFSMFKEASLVTMRTRASGKPSVEMEFVPIREGGRVIDVIVRRRVGADPAMAIGTTIEVTRETQSAVLEAAFTEVYMKRYGGYVNPSRMRIYYNGRQINRELDEIFLEETSFGTVRVLRGAEAPLLNRREVFVSALNLALYYNLPPTLRSHVATEGIVVDLSSGVDLTRDQSGVIGWDDIAPELNRILANALLRFTLNQFIEGSIPFSALPYDLYKNSDSYKISSNITHDAFLVMHEGEVDLEKYMNEENFQWLVISMKAIPVMSGAIELKSSLLDVIRYVKSGSVKLDDLPPAVAEWIVIQKSNIERNMEASADIFKSKDLVAAHRIAMADEPAAQADSYWAYLELANFIGELMNDSMPSDAPRFKVSRFVSSPKNFRAQAWVFLGNVDWNLNSADETVELLSKILAGTATEDDEFKFWRQMISTASHEQTHMYEKADSLKNGAGSHGSHGDTTHDPTFFARNRIILDFLRAHSKELEEKLDEMRGRYNGAFISAAEFIGFH